MGIAFRLGPITVAWYGIMIMTGVIAAVLLSFVEARRRGEATDHVINLALVGLPLGIIGARLYHVIDQWAYYSKNPSLIIGGDGLGIYGAVIGGVIGFIIYTRWRKISTLRWLDIAAPGVILAQAIGRWGNFFNQELYGYPTSLPWGIYIDPQHRLPGFENATHFQPLFLYESLWDALGCVLLLLVGRKLKDRLLAGDIFYLYVIYYGIGRFFLEGLKINVWTLGGIPTARWISGLGIIIALAVMVYRHYRRRQSQRRPSGAAPQAPGLPQ
ncbi:MAG: prolipoprotein diacylglyceryl transferase [Chloroflexota bacterium]